MSAYPKGTLSPRELYEDTLQALLTEYSCLRTEAQQDDTHQIQLVTISFSALVALAAAAATLSDNIPEKVGLFFFLILLPCLVMFLGLLWIDLIYRRTRFGCYTKRLENKINALLQEKTSFQPIMEWEHWIQDLEDGKGFFRTTRFFRGYIVSGSWLISPLLVTTSYILMAEGPVFQTLSRIFSVALTFWPLTLFMAAVYGVYYGLFYIYLKKITGFPHLVP